MITGPALHLYDRVSQMAQARWSTLQGQELPQQSVQLPVEESYWNEQLDLGRDPARGGKLDRSTLEEAAVAVHAQRSHVLSKLEREPTGHSEFKDWQSQCWDVKSPISPPPDKQGWVFDANHQAEVVQQEVVGGEGVLLNLTRCKAEDAAELRQTLLQRLQPWELSKVLVLSATDWAENP